MGGRGALRTGRAGERMARTGCAQDGTCRREDGEYGVRSGRGGACRRENREDGVRSGRGVHALQDVVGLVRLRVRVRVKG